MGSFLIVSFFAIPVAAIIFFLISLCSFLSAKKKIKLQPDSIHMQEFKTRKLMMIISSIVAGVLVTVVICFCILLASAITYM